MRVDDISDTEVVIISRQPFTARVEVLEYGPFYVRLGTRITVML